MPELTTRRRASNGVNRSNEIPNSYNIGSEFLLQVTPNISDPDLTYCFSVNSLKNRFQFYLSRSPQISHISYPSCDKSMTKGDHAMTANNGYAAIDDEVLYRTAEYDVLLSEVLDFINAANMDMIPLHRIIAHFIDEDKNDILNALDELHGNKQICFFRNRSKIYKIKTVKIVMCTNSGKPGVRSLDDNYVVVKACWSCEGAGEVEHETLWGVNSEMVVCDDCGGLGIDLTPKKWGAVRDAAK